MRQYVEWVIVGAADEMECEGEGCGPCPYAISSDDTWACRVSGPDDPVAMLARLEAECGLSKTKLAEGRTTDGGTVYGVRDLDGVVRGLSTGLREAGLACTGDEHFNERQALKVALRLLKTAQRHKKPVLVQV